ncbi:KH domain-containing protein akap-1-like [Myzus persicae]|uniref:KH domain-containing protein akap-1-like n=1 Tax=Myzus persicae TaxID=13164 RepID=UPI000B931378|nr:KH domain-containing protein akap-1-like [Myzus persicae]XP_022160405.1 KH domain-containing protein akap-1-like [Myzus persicae]XP_022160406.1 KH domain-containing protein akap-1-like [Myzus persicae]XP_022160407.1 KH domain-containing protein akap-1-like [Myzus persicae]XP_022168573.1 KH domain-containing protein akap-1-like [Myzus persicae]
MFKVRTVSLGRILTFSTAVLYLGYLWYKRKRTLSHHQSDKKRPCSEPSELTKIDDQELFRALEEASCILEVSQGVEEKLIESSVIHKETMEPTVSQIEVNEKELSIGNQEVHEMVTKVITSEQQVCLESDIITIDSLTEDLTNLKLSTEIEKGNDIVINTDDSTNIHQVIEKKKEELEEYSKDKACWTAMIEKEDHCECPKAVLVKKVKKDEEPMIFEGIKFKGKKKKGRKKNQTKDIIKLPSESNSKNKTNNVVKSVKKNQIVEEDCDSAHSVDHSIDTNDAPNTIYSDIRSVGSQDSGKGGSSFSGELRTVSDSDEQTSYDFLVPIELVGPIIGKKGAFVKYIKEKSNVRLFVENKTESPEDKYKMCTLVGSEININKALKLIRTKFPERAYPEFTLECISSMLDGSPVISQLFKSELIEGVNNHVIVTDLVATDHFFVHNASSPDYAMLSSLNFAMNDTFGNSKEDIPEVDLRTVTHGSVVATFSEDNWYRAQVIDVDEKKYESANVFFLDYGGCKKIEQCDMRPMHDSLISLSFQAIECSLANIAPIYGEWCEESLKMFETLTTGKMLFAQVVYKSDSIQYVNLLAFDGLVTISINDELIKYGFAVYAPPSGIYRNDTTPELNEPTHAPA